jgi:hypothetical protein
LDARRTSPERKAQMTGRADLGFTATVGAQETEAFRCRERTGRNGVCLRALSAGPIGRRRSVSCSCEGDVGTRSVTPKAQHLDERISVPTLWGARSREDRRYAEANGGAEPRVVVEALFEEQGRAFQGRDLDSACLLAFSGRRNELDVEARL